MIPQDKNIQERLGIASVLVLGLLAILMYMKIEPLPVAIGVILLFAALIGYTDQILRKTHHTE